jgi:hypothetical protein
LSDEPTENDYNIVEGKVINMIQEEDKKLVYDLIYLDLLIEVLERDLKAIDLSSIKFKSPYKKKIESLIKEALNERKDKRQVMRKQGIKIFERKVIDEEFIEWEYVVRGYEAVQRIWTAAIRKRLQEILIEKL